MGSDDDGTSADAAPSSPADTPAPEPEHERAPEEEPGSGFDRWRKESALGSVGTGIARGLQSVFGSPPQEIAIVAEVPGEPPDADKRLRVILDPDDPSKSIAVVPPAPVDAPLVDTPPSEGPPPDPPPA
jgi:hypothetical protein